MKSTENNKKTHAKYPFVLLTYAKFIVFVLWLSYGNLGCNKDDTTNDTTTNNTPQTFPDTYYVKYIVRGSTIYSGSKMNKQFTTEKNNNMSIVIDQNSTKSTTIGPVSKGFKATLSIVAIGNTHDKLKLYTEIQVSKNNDPFAVKAINNSDTPRDEVTLNYTIDY
jgi:hypothetical protein